MTGIARVGKDFAGGIILDSGNTSVLAEGSPVVVPGDAVAGHGMAPHSTAVMVRASHQGIRRSQSSMPCRRLGVLWS